MTMRTTSVLSTRSLCSVCRASRTRRSWDRRPFPRNRAQPPARRRCSGPVGGRGSNRERRPRPQAEPQTRRLTDRRGGQAGAREQPRHPDRPLQPADRGPRRRCRPRPPGRRRSTNTLQKNSTGLADQQLPRRRPGGKTTERPAFSNATGVSQQTAVGGGNYSVGWDSSRSTTNSTFTTFSPQLRSSLSLSYTQPLLRNFSIDNTRQQLLVSLKNREIADVQLRQTIAHDDAHGAQRLLGPRLRDRVAARAAAVARARAGVAAQHRVARRDRHHAADRHRRGRSRSGHARRGGDRRRGADRDGRRHAARAGLRSDVARLLDHAHRAVDLPPFQPITVDVDAAVRNALERRTDLQQTTKTLEANDVNIRYLRNQTLPDVTASFDYGLSGPRRHAARARRRPLRPGHRHRRSARAQRGFGVGARRPLRQRLSRPGRRR